MIAGFRHAPCMVFGLVWMIGYACPCHIHFGHGYGCPSSLHNKSYNATFHSYAEGYVFFSLTGLIIIRIDNITQVQGTHTRASSMHDEEYAFMPCCFFSFLFLWAFNCLSPFQIEQCYFLS